jgi:RHS repeat-associated protein
MVATAPSAPSTPAGLPAQGRSASRIASDRRGGTWVSPENAGFEHLDQRRQDRAAATCIGRARPHRRDSHPGRRRSSGQTRGGRYCRARYYHPGLQRFIGEDPLGLFGGGTNLYSYVGNNPTQWRDPLGLYTEIIIWEGVGIGKSSLGHVSVTSRALRPNELITVHQVLYSPLDRHDSGRDGRERRAGPVHRPGRGSGRRNRPTIGRRSRRSGLPGIRVRATLGGMRRHLPC